MICGTIHPNDTCVPHDARGCLLGVGHTGPHEFVSAGGVTYQWESDLECADCDPDECDCTIYWRKQYSAAER